MRLDHHTKTLLAVAVATSAVLMILVAAPAASTAGSPGRVARGSSTHPGSSVTVPAPRANAQTSEWGSPIQEVASMRTAAAVRRHEAWLAERRASKRTQRAGHPGSPGSSSASRLAASGSVHDMVVALFSRIAGAGQVSTALCIANRESHFDPYARNPYSSAAGVFQWVAASWRSYSARYGFAGSSVFDAYANIAVAAHAVANGGWGPWGGGCW